MTYALIPARLHIKYEENRYEMIYAAATVCGFFEGMLKACLKEFGCFVPA